MAWTLKSWLEFLTRLLPVVGKYRDEGIIIQNMVFRKGGRIFLLLSHYCCFSNSRVPFCFFIGVPKFTIHVLV